MLAFSFYMDEQCYTIHNFAQPNAFKNIPYIFCDFSVPLELLAQQDWESKKCGQPFKKVTAKKYNLSLGI